MIMPVYSTQRNTYTVSQVNNAVEHLISKDRRFADIDVKGEISQCRRNQNGHLYLTVKDKNSQMDVVMWKNCAANLEFRPQAGDNVICSGKITLYAPFGKYQLEAYDIRREDGTGEQAKAKKELYEKLDKEGLFSRKRSLPQNPRKIAVVTAPGSAAEKDITSTMQRRCPVVKLVIVPALVQGANAPRSLVEAIDKAQKTDADLLIISRGGGAADDLGAFDDESVARAVFNSRIPTVCAIGHEINVSVAECAADLRASTPTAAAEQSVPDLSVLREKICAAEAEISRRMKEMLSAAENRLNGAVRLSAAGSPENNLLEKEHRLEAAEDKIRTVLHSRLDTAGKVLESRIAGIKSATPGRKISEYDSALNGLAARFFTEIHGKLEAREKSLAGVCGVISALNPMSVLERGYSVTRSEGKCITNAEELSVGQTVETGLRSGSFTAVVKEIRTGNGRAEV